LTGARIIKWRESEIEIIVVERISYGENPTGEIKPRAGQN